MTFSLAPGPWPLAPVFVSLATLLVGVAGRAQPAEKAAESAGPHGVVFVVGGIGGIELLNASAHVAFPKAGVPHEIRDFVWTHGKGKFFKDLQDLRYVLQKATELADQVRDYKQQYPDRPVYLLGKSGGAGLVLAAAEQLPPNTLERIILLSAAVSPRHDLHVALQSASRGIVSFYSPLDQLILGWGTKKFGTEDRYYGPSAGLRGFQVPPLHDDEERDLYNRLIQVPWHASMIFEGYVGNHMGTSMPTFLGAEVAKWLKP